MVADKLGPYRIESELGAGGMGKVYAATVAERVPGLPDGARVAIKLVHQHLLETPGFFRRFLREAEVGKSVTHENVVQTYMADALVVDGAHHNFLVMEYVEGQTLRDLLDELDRVPEELCRHVGREVAKGLTAIHEAGIVHRDLKPENVLITEDHTVKVMDLGVARLQDEAVRLSQTGAFVGSLHYAAPEQFSGGSEDELDGRADLHALGLMLYELACHRHPFMDEDFRKVIHRVVHDEPRRVSEINPQLSPFFEEVIHTLLAKEPGDRFASAAALFDVLDEGESGEWWQERAKALRIETKRPLRRIRIVRETALYGRDAELDKLQSLYAKAKSGDGQVLVLEGEAGIGKTRLIDEFVGNLQQEGEDLNFLFGAYPPGGAATAAGAFSTAYREHFGSAALEEALREYLVETPVLIPAFAALLRGDSTPKNEEPLTKDSLQTVFVHVTRALAAERPTVVLIDDLHFAPEDGRALFAAIAQALVGHKILLIGTTRPGLAEDWVANLQRLEHSSQMTLHRIGPKDLIRMLQETLRSERLAHELGAAIALKSDGNPFFVFEIIRGLREGQFITQEDDGTWVSTRVIDQIQIPSSVMDLIEARIVDLDEDDRDLLDVASCCGFDFDPLLLGRVLGLADIPLLKRLGRLEKANRLVRSSGRRFVFDHHQVQEALYEGLSELLRERYHAAIGDAFEATTGAAQKEPDDLDGAIAVELCQHFLKGGQGEKGIRYLDRALTHLEDGYVNDAVIEFADRALAITGLVTGDDRVELLLRKAECLSLLGRNDETRTVLDEAVQLAEEGENVAINARVRTSLGSFLGRTQFEESRATLEGALELARQSGDKKVEAKVAGALGHALVRLAREDEALTLYERSLELARELGDTKAEAGAIGGLAQVCWALGEFEQAQTHGEQQLELARKRQDRGAESSAVGQLGITRWSVGRFGDARDLIERAAHLAREIGARRTEAIATGNLGEASLRLGDLPGARRWSAAAMSACAAIDLPWMESSCTSRLGEAAEAEGDMAEAERLHRTALALLRDFPSPQHMAEVLLILGGLLASKGETDEARTLLEEALELARELDIGVWIVCSAARLATLPGGDAAPAVEAFAKYGDRMHHYEKMEARFRLFQATGDKEHLGEAHRLLTFARERSPEDCRETMITNVPLHRDIMAAWAEHGAGNA